MCVIPHLTFCFLSLTFHLFAFRAADFNCRLPVNSSSTKVFVLTFIGLFLPCASAILLGSLLMTVPAYANIYTNGDAANVFHEGAAFYPQ
jgi:purine-cytosine permease-like protein